MEMFDRQIRVFGKAGQRALQKLTVGIVGVGGIGSLIFVLLVRLGVGCIVIIDNDHVEESNLNRLAGSTLSDVKNKTPKVTMLKRYAKEINQKIKIIAVKANILEEDAQQYLKLCDVFFGCTDNQSSRWILNIFSIKYLIPYIDTGTGIKADANHNIEHAGGQVRVVIPSKGCLNCIDGIDISIAQQEMLPEDERQIAIKLGYIDGADIHSPAVAPLNGTIANLAVTEFVSLVTGFKPIQRYIFYDFLKASVVPIVFNKNPHCFTCSHLGSLAIGDHGKPFPVEMLINELKPQTETQGDLKMESEITNKRHSIENLLTTAQQHGFEIEGNSDAQWFLIKDVTLGNCFNEPTTNIMVKFHDDSNDPIILLPENLSINTENGICGNFLEKTPYIKDWKSLCPHMFQDIGDELFEFITCLTGFLANPSLCGLMGCEGKALVQTSK